MITEIPTFEATHSTISDSDVVELPLLLPRWQAEALENVASRNGMTIGQMLRKLLTDSLRTNKN